MGKSTSSLSLFSLVVPHRNLANIELLSGLSAKSLHEVLCMMPRVWVASNIIHARSSSSACMPSDSTHFRGWHLASCVSLHKVVAKAKQPSLIGLAALAGGACSPEVTLVWSTAAAREAIYCSRGSLCWGQSSYGSNTYLTSVCVCMHN